jgi:hypothetical protein
VPAGKRPGVTWAPAKVSYEEVASEGHRGRKDLCMGQCQRLQLGLLLVGPLAVPI